MITVDYGAGRRLVALRNDALVRAEIGLDPEILNPEGRVVLLLLAEAGTEGRDMGRELNPLT
eukprot:m.181657 g.181657  ORF g.181657 m.181657 type:complete len:62 (+) comp16632_c0_seq2:213-398(+)